MITTRSYTTAFKVVLCRIRPFPTLISNIKLGLSYPSKTGIFLFLVNFPSKIGFDSIICCSIGECCPEAAARNCNISFVDSVFPLPDSPDTTTHLSVHLIVPRWRSHDYGHVVILNGIAVVVWYYHVVILRVRGHFKPSFSPHFP